jgi:hypothetical protein
MFALISNEELSAQGQILVKQLKNRYNDPNVDKRFVIGIDRSRMKLMDAPQEHTMALVQDTPPVFDNTSSGKRMMGEQQKSFSGFKMS